MPPEVVSLVVVVVVVVVVLSPLLYVASEELAWRDLRAVWRPVAVLAVGLVLASAAAVAAVGVAVASLSASMAFVLGAVLASTDPVAVSALARRLSLPVRVQTGNRHAAVSDHHRADPAAPALGVPDGRLPRRNGPVPAHRRPGPVGNGG